MDRKIITQEDVKEIISAGGKRLVILDDTTITSLARDLINKEGIKLEYKDKTKVDPLKNNSTRTKETVYSINDFTKDLILQFYYLMLKIRLFEQLAKTYKEKGIIPGDFVHLYLGQEAIAVGVCSALEKKDYITSTHRGHGHLIAKGADISKMLAELIGKVDGYCKGKGGSMHISDIGLGILGANGIVGAGLPIACGSALASKFNRDKVITVSFFGDGASNQGTFGESLNFAKIFSLPVIFLCENNNLAVSTPVSYSCGSPDIYKRGLGYGVESELINGDDVFEVYLAVKRVLKEIRKEPHPVLIEAITHRQIGHWVGDPQKYRTAEELADLPNHDPLRIFLAKIKGRSNVTNLDLEGVESKVVDEIKKAADFADKSSYPPLENATKDYLKE
ncbi:MAG: thiamine pyrophosphate-dependent dehydrogenase E1 component subunit alpha [Actinobacteria bacterium]|nr:thiamine pyrophosphate-dependent dehydrogenase E1 component subunit alpha [Actinomycetota bacterium]